MNSEEDATLADKFISVLKGGVQELFPGYFSLVMASGIISIAAHLLGMKTISLVLFGFNKAAYIILWVLLLARLVFYFKRVIADLSDHLRGPGFFTLIAGTCVLGSQYVLLSGDVNSAGFLWVLGFILWHLLIYAVFSILMLKNTKPAMESGINGTWLIAIVATQSISVLGTLLASHLSTGKEMMLFYTLTMYLLGGMLYILVIGLILYRLLFFHIEPVQLTPPFWVSMGAVAISTLAGDILILSAEQWNFIAEILPFLKGMNIFFWATATWWIPLLVIMGVWRHIYKRFPLRYDPSYWSMVFPLGMYTVCTFQLAKALEMPFLYTIPRYFVFIALAAWLVTFIGLIYRMLGSLLSPSPSQATLRP